MPASSDPPLPLSVNVPHIHRYVKGESYHNVSMGQGQDVIAMACLETAHRNGHWVILNNIHLMPRWLLELEKKLDEFMVDGGGSHAKMRLFLTSDPSNAIPIGVLNRCIKLTNEPPAGACTHIRSQTCLFRDTGVQKTQVLAIRRLILACPFCPYMSSELNTSPLLPLHDSTTGLKANLKRAWANFPKADIDDADSKTKSILFGLCYFHAIMMERKLFGTSLLLGLKAASGSGGMFVLFLMCCGGNGPIGLDAESLHLFPQS